MLNEFLNKQITVPMYKYEQLIENETRYNQLFEWQHKHGNDEILRTIDNEKLKDLIINEETAATKEVVAELDDEIEDYYDVECITEYVCIPKGAKGKCLQANDSEPYVDWDEFYEKDCDGCYDYEIGGIKYKNVFSVPCKYLKKLNEKKEEN